MKYFVTEIFKNNIYVVLVADMTIKSSTLYNSIRKTNANILGVDERFVILGCVKNGKVEYIYGAPSIVNNLRNYTASEINWTSK